MLKVHGVGLAVALLSMPILMGADGKGCGVVVVGEGDDGGGQSEPGNPGNGPISSCGTEFHIFGVYETHSNHSGADDHPEGEATIHIERPGSHVIALSSYEPVHWTVTMAPGVTLEKVILNGYHDQRADVPAGVPVESHDGTSGWLGAYGYAWPSSEGGSDTPALVGALEAAAGQEMTSFHGCYSSTSFVLHDDLSVAAGCDIDGGYALTGHVEEPSCGPGTPSCGPELHLLSVYESHGNHGWNHHPEGEASVHVERQGPVVLALSSYEPVYWKVTAAPGVTLEKVILNGYHDQRADVPPGVPVEIYDADQMLAACAYQWPGDDQGCDTQGLVSALESVAGRSLTSFHGCYQANTFVLHDDIGASSSCSAGASSTQSSYMGETCGD
ncbi:hypothetical protein [Chondromyces crocatus]|uniref:Secreted protein n=1 Tax=Chondromyces crocatus TaxID=52 RepID=A0A0K1ENZ2_CHOCO|nr:hypothetical protein [Chondromyces crocatus]AKT42625.1 uncharacterized protein CMC5_068520 [Chondromyces crocatus]